MKYDKNVWYFKEINLNNINIYKIFNKLYIYN